MKTTLQILENEIKWKINAVQKEKDYIGKTSYLLALEGVLRQIEGLKDEEKRLITNAYVKGYLEEVPNPSPSHYYEDMAEQYFNETFKKTNNEKDSSTMVN